MNTRFGKQRWSCNMFVYRQVLSKQARVTFYRETQDEYFMEVFVLTF